MSEGGVCERECGVEKGEEDEAEGVEWNGLGRVFVDGEMERWESNMRDDTLELDAEFCGASLVCIYL